MATSDQNHQSHRKRVKRYDIVRGIHYETFSTYRRLELLTNDLWRMRLAESVRRGCDRTGFLLWAYVFMPEHVHLLVKAKGEEQRVSELLSVVKLDFSTWLLSHLRAQNLPLLEQLTVRERPGKTCGRVWQEGGGYSVNILSLERAREKAAYIHRNPVRKGYVTTPDRWKFSSYRWLEMNEREDAPLVIDDWSFE